MSLPTRLFVLACLFPLSANAGSFECSSFKCSWQPTDCHRPSPMRITTDLDGNPESFNAWVKGMDSYVECVRDEAIRDAQRMQRAMSEAVKREQEETTASVRRMRAIMPNPRR